jgi:hypothetical protein
MDIVFINHQKSQCGVYEIGKRIHELFDQNILNIKYFETGVYDEKLFREIIENENPKYVICNYYPDTLKYINKNLFNSYSNIKFIGIIHDLLHPHMIDFYDSLFDCWIIHDTTNMIQSKKKFTTIRPIRRFEKKPIENKILNLGSHGFGVSPWKMFDSIISKIHDEFDEVNINMNITQATFGGADDSYKFQIWKNIIKKENVSLNITNTYFENEIDLINFLSKNDLNIYFYNPHNEYVGVGGSADLAISSQSSLVVNKTHMYRHIHEYLGYYEQKNNLKEFLNNKNIVSQMYEDWNPHKMTIDYKKMIESI